MAIHTGNDIPTDPNSISVALNVNASCTPKDSALAGDIRCACYSTADEPLGYARIEAPRNWIFKTSGSKSPDFKIGCIAVLTSFPRRDDTYPQARDSCKIWPQSQNIFPAFQENSQPTGTIVDPMSVNNGFYIDMQGSRDAQ